MPVKAKLGGEYMSGTVLVKHQGSYMEGTVYQKLLGTYVQVSGDGPGPSTTPSLDFSDPNNSMYLALISVGGM